MENAKSRHVIYKNMERIYVESSNIASIGYDQEMLILEVEFRNGTIYQYYDIPSYIFEGLMQADSKGKYFNVLLNEESIGMLNCKYEYD